MIKQRHTSRFLDAAWHDKMNNERFDMLCVTKQELLLKDLQMSVPSMSAAQRPRYVAMVAKLDARGKDIDNLLSRGATTNHQTKANE